MSDKPGRPAPSGARVRSKHRAGGSPVARSPFGFRARPAGGRPARRMPQGRSPRVERRLPCVAWRIGARTLLHRAPGSVPGPFALVPARDSGRRGGTRDAGASRARASALTEVVPGPRLSRGPGTMRSARPDGRRLRWLLSSSCPLFSLCRPVPAGGRFPCGRAGPSRF